MSPAEQHLYALAKKADARKQHGWSSGGRTGMAVDQGLRVCRFACTNLYTSTSTTCGEYGTLDTDNRAKLPYSLEDVQKVMASTTTPGCQCGETDCEKYGYDYLADGSRDPQSPWHAKKRVVCVPDIERCTKLRALRDDLLALRKEDPSMHAVVVRARSPNLRSASPLSPAFESRRAVYSPRGLAPRDRHDVGQAAVRRAPILRQHWGRQAA